MINIFKLAHVLIKEKKIKTSDEKNVLKTEDYSVLKQNTTSKNSVDHIQILESDYGDGY
jgi:hypothetical protein